MKTYLFLFCITFVSCLNYSKNKSDVIDSNHINLTGLNTSTKLQKDITELNNDSLWRKIVTKPDSVPVSIAISDSLNAMLTISGRLDSNYYTLESIKVVFTNGIKQVLKIKGSVVTWTDGQNMPYISNLDMNFDGEPDLRLFDNAGATGNFWYSTWIYDRKKGFVFSQDVSDISAPKIDMSNKQIISYNRFGYCEETIVYYDVLGLKVKPVRYLFNQHEGCVPDSGCKECVTYKKELEGGKWKVSKIGEMDGELKEVWSQ